MFYELSRFTMDPKVFLSTDVHLTGQCEQRGFEVVDRVLHLLLLNPAVANVFPERAACPDCSRFPKIVLHAPFLIGGKIVFAVRKWIVHATPQVEPNYTSPQVHATRIHL